MKIDYLRTIGADTYADGQIRRIQSLAFRPDGSRLFVGDNGSKKVHIWDAKSGGLTKAINVRLEDVPHLAVSPDGKRFAVGGGSGAVWDSEKEEQLFKLGKFSDLGRIAFSPNGELVACANDKQARVWSSSDGAIVHKLKHKRAKAANLAFASDSPRLFVVTQDESWSYPENRMVIDGEIQVLDLGSGKTVATSVRLETATLLEASSAGVFLRRIPQINAKGGLTRGGPGDVWNLELGSHASIQVPEAPPTLSMRSSAVLADGRIVTLELTGEDPTQSPGADQRRLRVWDLLTKTMDEVVLDEATYGQPLVMAAAPDGTVALATVNAVHLARISG